MAHSPTTMYIHFSLILRRPQNSKLAAQEWLANKEFNGRIRISDKMQGLEQEPQEGSPQPGCL
jgi:hypothetical protein